MQRTEAPIKMSGLTMVFNMKRAGCDCQVDPHLETEGACSTTRAPSSNTDSNGPDYDADRRADQRDVGITRFLVNSAKAHSTVLVSRWAGIAPTDRSNMVRIHRAAFVAQSVGEGLATAILGDTYTPVIPVTRTRSGRAKACATRVFVSISAVPPAAVAIRFGRAKACRKPGRTEVRITVL